MSWLPATFIESTAQIVTWTLVHSLWQGSLIALLLGGLLLVLRRAGARARYAASCCALAAMFVAALATGVHVTADLAELNATPLYAETTTAPAPAVSDAPPAPPAEIANARGVVTDDEAAAATLHSVMTALNERGDLARGICVFWLVGVGALSLFNIAGWYRVRGLGRRGLGDLPADLRGRIQRLCAELDVDRPLRAYRSGRVKVPCVIGWLKPVVLVPAGALCGMDARELELILAHELAHVRRNDILIGYLQAAVETLLFFHPATWWISRRIRVERENCCDDAAVRVTGDHLAYARALTRMETLRRGEPGRLAAAADGGSLLGRVRRLAGLPARGDVRRSSTGMIGLVMLLTLVGAGVLTVGGPADHAALAAEEPFAPAGDDLEGFWQAWVDGDEIELKLEFKTRRGNSSLNFRSDGDRIEGLRGLDRRFPAEFALERDAGTFHCIVPEGKIGKSRRASGDCWFRGDPGYIDEMERLGYSVRDRNLFELALHGVGLDFARGVAEAGFTGVSLRKLTELRIHGIDLDYIREMGELGYGSDDVDDVLEMKIHGIDPGYVRAMTEAGFKPANRGKLVDMKIHDISPDYMAEMREAGFEIDDLDRLVEMKIHGISPRYVRELREAGFDTKNTGDLLEMKIHGVTPDYVAGMAKAGYRPRHLDKILEMKIHGIDPRYVQEMSDAGFGPEDHDRLLEMKIHGISPDFIREMNELGYEPRNSDKLLEMKIHGIDAGYVREMAEAGVKPRDTETLLEMKIHGVGKRYVEELRDAGLKAFSAEELVGMKVYGVDRRFIREMIEEHGEDIDADDVLKQAEEENERRYGRTHRRYRY